MDQIFFKLPFADDGDKTAIPLPLQIDGAVSFDQGWTFDYQRDQTIDPLAKDIDRGTMNYLFNAITLALQQYQTTGIPEWISTADNGGAPFSYDQGVDVRYRAGGGDPFIIYTSLIAANTSTPGTDATKWAIAFNVGQTAIGGLTNANVVLTQAQAAKPVLFLSGALSANIQIIIPAVSKNWLIFDSTTGPFTVTIKTAGGAGSTTIQGQVAQMFCDGVITYNILGAYLRGDVAAATYLSIAAAAATYRTAAQVNTAVQAWSPASIYTSAIYNPLNCTGAGGATVRWQTQNGRLFLIGTADCTPLAAGPTTFDIDVPASSNFVSTLNAFGSGTAAVSVISQEPLNVNSVTGQMRIRITFFTPNTFTAGRVYFNACFDV